MIEMDRKVYEKMVGIWSITRMPKLEMIVQSDHVSFTWVKGPITKVPYKIFDELAPIEIVNLIEQQAQTQQLYGKTRSLQGCKVCTKASEHDT